MNIFFDAQGNILSQDPSSIYQGSNKANTIYLVAPFTNTNQITIAFRLPNQQSTEPFLATFANDVFEQLGINCWKADITEPVTQLTGEVLFQFRVFTAAEQTIATGSGSFLVQEGVFEELPEEPTQDIYEQILSQLAKSEADVSEAIALVGELEEGALELQTSKLDSTHATDAEAHSELFELKVDKKPDGTVDLIGEDYKIDEKYLPPFVVSGGLVFGGTFGADGLIVATSRTPELNGTLIDDITLATYPSVYFKATASYEFGGKSYDAGDIAICNGDITPNWTKIDGSDAVTGVKGNNEVAYRLGNVNLTKDNIGLGNVDNTSDLDKPISTLAQAELAKKVNNTGDETISGNKTFSGTITVPAPTADLHAATRKYVDDSVVGNPIVTSWSDPLSDAKVPSEKLTKESLDDKADKVTSATNGNFAGLNSTGNLTDSGKKASDFAELTDGNINLATGKTYKINNVSIIDIIYPVNSVYLSVNSTSPASLFGGTWTQLKDRFLLGTGDTYTNGATGGAATHTLTVSEMPSHNHNSDAQFSESSGNWASVKTGTSTGIGYGPGISYKGGGQAHNNMPPYLVVYMWKRTE